MAEYEQRRKELIRIIAAKADGLPMPDSGLWFHHDIRDNFYYASYLYAAAEDGEMEVGFDRQAARAKAGRVLREVLRLQEQDPSSPTFGHWPLGLHPTPQTAPKNPLPVELMGSLMAYFYQTYKSGLDDGLRHDLERAVNFVYQSGFYRKPLEHFHHHEAKYTAAKLIFGQLFQDRELLEDGRSSLRETLERVRQIGMSEYGCLPWFWHWVQAYTCAWKLADDAELGAELERMLDYLWSVRAAYYLGGAWAGPHSRGLRHDLPTDKNVLMDYVQFGDFELPEEMPRTEYAGFLFYKAPERARITALQRQEPAELKSKVPRPAAIGGPALHSYVYMTPHYAVGGIWERAEEFDNEQHRFEVTLPLRTDRSVNRAYFFLAADANAVADPRHQSGHTDVLFHENCAVALFYAPGTVVGCIPKGEWRQAGNHLYGSCGEVLLAVCFQQPLAMVEMPDRWTVTTTGEVNGVVLECMDWAEAKGKGIADLDDFVKVMERKQPVFGCVGAAGEGSAAYTTLRGDRLELGLRAGSGNVMMVNGRQIGFEDYTYMTE